MPHGLARLHLGQPSKPSGQHLGAVLPPSFHTPLLPGQRVLPAPPNPSHLLHQDRLALPPSPRPPPGLPAPGLAPHPPCTGQMIRFKCEPGLVPVTLASLRVEALVFRGIQGPESCRLLPAITCHPSGLMSPSRPFAHLAPATPASSLLCRLRLLSRLGASPLPLPLAAPRAPTGPRFQPHPTRQACPGGPPGQPGTHSRLPSRYSWLWGIVTLCSVAVCRPRTVSPHEGHLPCSPLRPRGPEGASGAHLRVFDRTRALTAENTPSPPGDAAPRGAERGFWVKRCHCHHGGAKGHTRRHTNHRVALLWR